MAAEITGRASGATFLEFAIAMVFMMLVLGGLCDLAVIMNCRSALRSAVAAALDQTARTDRVAVRESFILAALRDRAQEYLSKHAFFGSLAGRASFTGRVLACEGASGGGRPLLRLEGRWARPCIVCMPFFTGEISATEVALFEPATGVTCDVSEG